MKILRWVFLLAIIAIVGCASLGLKVDNTGVCDGVTPDNPSYFCDLADKYKVDISTVGTMISVANVVYISKDKYKAKEALKVLQDIRTVLNNPVAYTYVQKRIRQIASDYPELFIMAKEYVDELSMPMIMYKYDQQILISWIDIKIEDMKLLSELRQE